jgi:hypothetical protein
MHAAPSSSAKKTAAAPPGDARGPHARSLPRGCVAALLGRARLRNPALRGSLVWCASECAIESELAMMCVVALFVRYVFHGTQPTSRAPGLYSRQHVPVPLCVRQSLILASTLPTCIFSCRGRRIYGRGGRAHRGASLAPTALVRECVRARKLALPDEIVPAASAAGADAGAGAGAVAIGDRNARVLARLRSLDTLAAEKKLEVGAARRAQTGLTRVERAGRSGC